MKKLQILFILISLFTLNPFITNPVNVRAQTPEISGTPENSETGLIISPNVLIIDDKDQGKTFTVKITNNSEENYKLAIAETRVIRDQEGRMVPVSAKNDENFLELNASELTLAAKSEVSFKVRLKLSVKITDNYPGVIISRSLANKEKSQNESGAVIINSIIIPVLTQNFQGELKVDNNLSIDYSVLSNNNSFKVLGELVNIGDKFFEPSGSLNIYKDGVKLYEHQFTSQVQGLLFPEEKKAYSYTWINNLDILRKIGNYTFESRVYVASVNKTFVSKVQLFYLPIDILLLLLAGALVLLFILIKFGQRISKRRNRLETEQSLYYQDDSANIETSVAEKTNINSEISQNFFKKEA